jgi:hypothetical protein
MSAALQLRFDCKVSTAHAAWRIAESRWKRKHAPPRAVEPPEANKKVEAGMAFYRKHTEGLLRRYMQASMLVGRAPCFLGDPVGRGWVSSRPVRSFEDAVIFVLDIESCLNKLGWLDREIISRVVLQEYTHAEAAVVIGVGGRTMTYRVPLALDRLTEKVLEAGLLLLPG